MGCQMNEYDSDYLAQFLVNKGFSPVNTPENADLILINTCAVRAKPEQKAYSFLGRMSSIKKGNPDLTIGMVGCLAQLKGPFHGLVPGAPFELGRELSHVQGLKVPLRHQSQVNVEAYQKVSNPTNFLYFSFSSILFSNYVNF